MRLRSEETETPPAYQWDLLETLAFVVIAFFLILLVEGCLLAVPGFDSVLLLCLGVWFAYYYGPTILPRIRALSEIRKLRKELNSHGKE